MVVNRMAFEKFLDLVILKGDLQSKEAKITMCSNGFEIINKLNSGMCGVSAKFVVKTTEVDEDIHEFGITDMVGFRKIFKGFKAESLNIVKSANKLVISSTTDKQKVSITLDKAEYVAIDSPKEKIISVIESARKHLVEVSDDEAKELISVGGSIDSSVITFAVKDHEILVTFQKGNEKEITFKMDVGTDVDDGVVSVGGSTIEIINSIKSGFMLGVNAGLPVYIGTSNEYYTVSYVLAPFRSSK